MRKILLVLLAALTVTSINAGEQPKLLIAAAASLRHAFDDRLIPKFEAENPGVKIAATYDSSGKLQTQIENGLAADLFISASPKQMDALKAKGFIEPGSVNNLLENAMVLIRPAGKPGKVTGFDNVPSADRIAIGDPASVPAGQYAKEIFTTLGTWEQVAAKASLGTNVTEVLSWVAENSAEVGVVYATDAASTQRVEVIARAPAGLLKDPVRYPVGRLKNSASPQLAEKFLAFLASPASLAVFAEYGFTAHKN